MSDNTPAGISSSGIEKVEQLVNEKVEERLNDLGIEIRSEDGNPSLEDVWIAGQPIGKIVVSTQKTAKSVEKEVEKNIENNSDSETEKGGSNEETMLPIERLARMKEQNENHPALPSNGKESFDRALSIFENFGTWSKKTPKGHTITSGLRNLLEAVTGEKLAWRQVYRAMDMLEKWTNGMIRHEQTNRHGHVLVAKERPSSAGT